MKPEARDDIADARSVFDTVSAGGTAIFRTDVGYAIVGHEPQAIAHIFAAKKRSFSKPCGCFGSLAMFDELIDAGQTARDFVRAVVTGHGLPLSIVGRYRPDHPIIARADPFVREHATRQGTMDLLMNAGPVHDEIARLALEAGRGVFGSSANISLSGSKYRFQDVEPELRRSVDLALDSGQTKYSHANGLGSTIIDLETFQPFRVGIRFDDISAIARQEFGIGISAVPIAV